MAQLFRPGALLLFKLVVLGVVLGVIVGIFVARSLVRGPLAAGDAPPQPIAFSHKHHVGDDGIDCRYCHASVENAAFAGVPHTDVCMSCHSQLLKDAAILEPLRASARTGEPLRWTRVHDLPDFVYFDHSIHVSRGVPCEHCHGAIDKMPLTRRVASLDMQWCLACHRDPVSHVASLRTQPLPDKRRLTDCSTCHR